MQILDGLVEWVPTVFDCDLELKMIIRCSLGRGHRGLCSLVTASAKGYQPTA